MYVQVHTSFGLKLQVQVSPQIQLYLTPPANHVGPISGLPPQSKLGLDLSCSDCQSPWQVFAGTATTTPGTTSPPAAGSSRTRLRLSLFRGPWTLAQSTYPTPVSTQITVPPQDGKKKKLEL